MLIENLILFLNPVYLGKTRQSNISSVINHKWEAILVQSILTKVQLKPLWLEKLKMATAIIKIIIINSYHNNKIIIFTIGKK